MSVEQLAIDTKIPRASIDALEEDRFTALPGPVFVKGFFRCCARSLSLDAEVVMALLYEHERAQQQLGASARRDRQAPQLLGRAALSHASSYAGQYPAPQYTASQVAAGSSAVSSTALSAGSSAMSASSSMSGLMAPMMPRSPVPGAPVQAVPGETALATVDAAPVGPLFDLRALRPLLARIRGFVERSRFLTRSVALVRGASNSRLIMWIMVSLMIALIVVTAFVMAGGTAPSLPQS